jgi:putative intracellular protease/amidase
LRTGSYYRFVDAGVDVVLASSRGGRPPMDPMSNESDYQTDSTHRFDADEVARAALASTVRLDTVAADDFDSIYYAGGHGPMWDLAEDSASIALIENMWRAGKPVATTCHGPAVLRHVVDTNGEPLVRGRRVTGFTNSEEADVDRVKAVPFLLEDKLRRLGGQFSGTDNWQPYTQVDGRLITGQNPNSSGPVADALLEQLKR